MQPVVQASFVKLTMTRTTKDCLAARKTEPASGWLQSLVQGHLAQMSRYCKKDDAVCDKPQSVVLAHLHLSVVLS